MIACVRLARMPRWDMAKTFYISDTHFQHDRILALSKRPFQDIAQMDAAIIRNWNEVVGHDDVVWHLGDFAMSANADKIAGVFYRLNGRKRLILGNHDYSEPGVVNPAIADLPWEEPPRDFAEITDGGHRLVLCHFALRSWPGRLKGAYHFFGHAHGDLPDFGRSRDVGVDIKDVAFMPRTFEELARRLK